MREGRKKEELAKERERRKGRGGGGRVEGGRRVTSLNSVQVLSRSKNIPPADRLISILFKLPIFARKIKSRENMFWMLGFFLMTDFLRLRSHLN